MRQFVCKYWAILGVVAMGLTLGACGPEETNLECESARDCGPDEICHVNFCVDPDLACLADNECRSYEQCVNLRCEERTTCESVSQCAPDKTCQGGNCVTRQCSNDGDCFSGLVCDEGICRTVPRQCTAVGQSCDPSEATRDEFACEDLGDGYACYRPCNEYRVCAQGLPSTRLDCGAGSVCVDAGGPTPVCQPSQCSGFMDSDADCAAVAAQDPEAFANGVHCSEIGPDTFTCEPAGLGAEGAQCASNTDCGEGLLCVNSIGPFEDLGSSSYCARACTNDSMCDGDDQCIGADTGVYHGVGICGDRCEPFGTTEEQCSSTVACTPVSSNDGICFQPTTRTRKLYESCGNNQQCPDNSQCVGLSSTQSRCLPLCDPTLATQDARDATCPSPSTAGYVQLAHFGQGVSAVDVYVDGEEAGTLDFMEATEDYLNVESGSRHVEVRLAGTSTVVFEDTLQIGRRAALSVAAVAMADGSAALLIHPVARDVSAGDEEASLRFVHGVAGVGIVDIVLVTENGDVTEQDDRVALIEGVGYGDASEFLTLELGGAAATVDAYILPAMSFDGDNAYAVFEGVEVEEGLVATVYAVGDVQDEVNQIAPELMLMAYASAPEGRKLGGYCYDLNSQSGAAPEIGSGICLETCRDSDDWGGSCTNSADACSPVGSGLGWCFPAGGRGAGESCDDDDDCGDALFCDGAGSDHGVCRSFCQPDEQTNPALGCAAGETCIPRSGYPNFGECRIGCTPDGNYSDPNCPEGMKSCVGDSETAYCSPSGDLGLGDLCGDPRVQNCQPGLVCAQNGRDLGGVIFEPFGAPEQGREATCRQLCTPFVEDTGCGEGFACSPITPDGESTTLGHCVEAIKTPIASLSACDPADIGKMCDDNSYCIPASSNQCVAESGQCLQFCDYATGRGCTGNTRCIEGFIGGPLLGVFGLCQ